MIEREIFVWLILCVSLIRVRSLLSKSTSLLNGHRSSLHAITASMESDSLERPEDEDSPEFKNYLRALLQMQANRARSGHAAPSSGSSDAYIVKLSRITMEKNARFRAGLPDDEIDYSYLPDDYQAAS